MVPYSCRLLQMNSNYASILSVQLRLSNIGFWLAELPFWNTAQMQQTKNIQPTEGRPAVYPQFTAKKWYFPASILTPRLLLWRVELGIRLATLSQVLQIMHYTQHPRGHLKGCLICVFRSQPLGIFKKDRNNWNKRRSQQNKSCKRKKNIISMSSLFFSKDCQGGRTAWFCRVSSAGCCNCSSEGRAGAHRKWMVFFRSSSRASQSNLASKSSFRSQLWPKPRSGMLKHLHFLSLARHFEGIKIMLVQDGCFASIGERLQNIQYIQYHNTMVDHLIHPCLNCPSGHRGRPNWVVRWT